MVTESVTALEVVKPEHHIERTDPTAAKWARERIDLIKLTICPTGIPDGEFQLFIEQCKRSDLDPLIGEAFCVPRRVKVGNDWVTKHVMQPAVAGMEARADRCEDYRGIKAATVYEGDEITIDEGSGAVIHKSNPLKRGNVKGAWAQAFRDGRALPIAWCAFADYVQKTRDGQTTEMWRTKAATMIVKCARAAALRLAYPNAFGGIYIREEMPEESAQPAAAPAPKTKAPPAPAPATASAVHVDKPASAKVIEGEVVAHSDSGRPIALVETAPAAEPTPTFDTAAVAREPGADDGAPSVADELLGQLECCSNADELREWLVRKNIAQAKGALTKAELESMRLAYNKRATAAKKANR
jgi:phage recombination protein Bet